ncbi:MAG: acylphosphatase [Thermoanaerobaculales bacterium]|nr:acylphosphatase [Thermoanaerobaculales bacterium]
MSLAHRVRVHGRVQGVGFRAFVLREAELRDLSGWVRNRFDGTVEALVFGDDNAVDGLLQRIREGPRFGRVDRVDVTVEAVDGEPPRGCHVRPDR